jgi:hypothetical protein
LLLVNPEASDRLFVLPAGSWWILLDTARSEDDGILRADTASYRLQAHSVALLRSQPSAA